KIDEIKIDINFVNKFLSIDEVIFNTVKKEFENIDFNYMEYLNEIPTSNSIVDIEKIIIPKLDSLKLQIELDGIEFYFRELFTQYFDNKFELLDLLQIENVHQKENYLKYTYSTLQNKTLESKRQELHNKESK